MTYIPTPTYNPKKSSCKVLAIAVLALSTSLSTGYGAESFGSHDSQKSNPSDIAILEGVSTPTSDSSRPMFEDRIEINLAKALNNPDLLHQHSYGTHNKTIAELRKNARDLKAELDKAKTCQTQIDEIKILLNENEKKLSEIGFGNQTSPLSQLQESMNNLQSIMGSFSQVPETLKQSVESMILQQNTEMTKFTEYRDGLITTKENLERELREAREQFDGITKPYGEFTYLEIHTNDAEEDLISAYAKHTMGPLGENLLTAGVMRKLLKTYKNCGVTIGAVDVEELYQLLARSLELPYYLCQEQRDKVDEWVGHADTLKKHLKLRLWDEVYGLNFGLQFSKACQFDLDLGLQSYFSHQDLFIGKENPELSKIVNGASIDCPLNENQVMSNINFLYKMIGSYGDKIVLPEKVNTILIERSGGYFGLCIESLSRGPVLSWTNPGSMSGINLILNHTLNISDTINHLMDMILKIVGQHMNVVVLDIMMDNLNKIKERDKMQKSLRKGSVSSHSLKHV